MDENKEVKQPTIPVQSVNKNRLLKWLTTVTPLSKALAMIIFILFPIVGFYLGMQYQKNISPLFQNVSNVKKNNKMENITNTTATSSARVLSKKDFLERGYRCNTGEKIAYYLWELSENSYVSDKPVNFFVSDKNGNNSKLVGLYSPTKSELEGGENPVIIGFNCRNNEVYFVRENPFPVIIVKSFSILNIATGKIEHRPIFPNDIAGGFQWSPDYQKVYETDGAHIYEFNLSKNTVSKVFSASQAALTSFAATKPQGDALFGLISRDFSITVDNKLIFYYNNNEILLNDKKPTIKYSLNLDTLRVTSIQQ